MPGRQVHQIPKLAGRVTLSCLGISMADFKEPTLDGSFDRRPPAAKSQGMWSECRRFHFSLSQSRPRARAHRHTTRHQARHREANNQPALTSSRQSGQSNGQPSFFIRLLEHTTRHPCIPRVNLDGIPTAHHHCPHCRNLYTDHPAQHAVQHPQKSVSCSCAKESIHHHKPPLLLAPGWSPTSLTPSDCCDSSPSPALSISRPSRSHKRRPSIIPSTSTPPARAAAQARPPIAAGAPLERGSH